jgi:RNA polymerase sigma factor (sigma-70 family)
MTSKKTVSVHEKSAVSADRTIAESGVSASPRPQPHTHSTTFEEIWSTHAKQILRVTQRITNNRQDAEDALQDSFLRAFLHLHTFDGRSSIATWLTRIAINSALMILRKRRNPPLLSIDGDVGPHAFMSVSQSATPEVQYEKLERQGIVREAVSGLRPSIRVPIELQTMEERSLKEIARMMGLSITATKSRLFHARTALRKSLAGKVSRRSGETTRPHLLPA